MNTLLIGSVYACKERDHYWYDMQNYFISKNTKDIKYDFKIFCNYKENIDNLKFESQIIGYGKNDKFFSENHVLGLNHIIKYAKENNYNHLLLMDSDCFPVQKKWFSILNEKMLEYKVAAPVRFENLDDFAHPSFFYVKNIKNTNLNFAFSNYKNLIGHTTKECLSNITNFYPLIRSNKINYDPIISAIYSNMCYHHGAGSRNKTFRCYELKYYDYYACEKNVEDVELKLFQRLIDDPKKFISDMMFQKQTNFIGLM